MRKLKLGDTVKLNARTLIGGLTGEKFEVREDDEAIVADGCLKILTGPSRHKSILIEKGKDAEIEIDGVNHEGLAVHITEALSHIIPEEALEGYEIDQSEIVTAIEYILMDFI